MTVTILVEPMRMKLEAMAKMTPARNVSTVSCSGRIHESPFSLTNGMTASYANDSTTHSSNRTRSKPPAMSGAYSL
jgi:hypothetical protein